MITVDRRSVARRVLNCILQLGEKKIHRGWKCYLFLFAHCHYGELKMNWLSRDKVVYNNFISTQWSVTESWQTLKVNERREKKCAFNEIKKKKNCLIRLHTYLTFEWVKILFVIFFFISDWIYCIKWICCGKWSKNCLLNTFFHFKMKATTTKWRCQWFLNVPRSWSHLHQTFEFENNILK